jgi:hypothetical protein
MDNVQAFALDTQQLFYLAGSERGDGDDTV